MLIMWVNNTESVLYEYLRYANLTTLSEKKIFKLNQLRQQPAQTNNLKFEVLVYSMEHLKDYLDNVAVEQRT